MTIKITPEIKSFWNSFISKNPSLEYLSNYKYEAFNFGDSKKMADEIGELVLAGKKIATSSLLRAYSGYEDELPKIADYSVLCDGNECPIGVTYTTDLRLVPFIEVGEQHAYEEGEGDRTLKFWRKEHLEFFQRNYPGFVETDLVICERFQVVFY